jgi:glycosyltransferase involved in cell wall biosynthesis
LFAGLGIEQRLALPGLSRLNRGVRFSIITPSFNQSGCLKRCIASVADQHGDVEHLVHDAQSKDETAQWLQGDSRVSAVIEVDAGMYDAINRGFRRATGDILAWLNCDEQFLPGALSRVEAFFKTHPAVDMVFGDIVLVDDCCQYLCHRRVERPLLNHTWVCHLSTLSCAMFFRRRVVDGLGGALLDTTYRCGGDGEWMVRLLRAGIRAAALREFTSMFTLREGNLSRTGVAREEWRRLRNTAPAWVRALSPLWVAQHRLRRLVGGSYRQGPFRFSVYTPESANQRVERMVTRPTFRCPG